MVPVFSPVLISFFTSPIRRYSDLMVHRMIHEYANENMDQDIQKHFKAQLPDVAEQTSTIYKEMSARRLLII